MGLSIESSVSVLTVFLQGILSFFSPCVLPLIPLYMGYLAGGMKTVSEDGVLKYPRKKVFVNTLFFVLGISFAFFALGFGFTTAGRFLSGNRVLFARIGGCIIVLFGLYQLGLFNSAFLNREKRLYFNTGGISMNPIIALIMGFTFSFAWTPCVGPALTSVLIMAGSASSSATGYLLIGIYTLGFAIPFLIVGLFTGETLTFLKNRQYIVKYTAKIGGVLLIIMGIMMFTGWMNSFTGYISNIGGIMSQQPDGDSSVGSQKNTDNEENEQNEQSAENDSGSSNNEDEKEKIPAPDFTLIDQFGEEHTLSDYKGKVVFLNFWASWCGPCKQEMPDIQKLYEEHGKNSEDLIILGVANPRSDESPYSQDVTVDELNEFLSDKGYTYPTVMDTTGEIFYTYGISSFPTTFMIDAEGNVFGYVNGMITKSIMDDIVQQTIDSLDKEE